MYENTTEGDISGEVWSCAFEKLSREHRESAAFSNKTHQSH